MTEKKRGGVALTGVAATVLSCATAAAGGEAGVTGQVFYPRGSQQSFRGPDEFFTGEVTVVMVFPASEHTRFSAAYVTFQPAARTAWHAHPGGQHIVVTAGVGLTGTRNGKVVAVGEGDALWCPPDLDHWHGATADSAMTHLVITGSKDGENVVWKEKVADADYPGTPR